MMIAMTAGIVSKTTIAAAVLSGRLLFRVSASLMAEMLERWGESYMWGFFSEAGLSTEKLKHLGWEAAHYRLQFHFSPLPET